MKVLVLIVFLMLANSIVSQIEVHPDMSEPFKEGEIKYLLYDKVNLREYEKTKAKVV